MATIVKNTIFTNVAETSDGGVYWEGIDQELPEGVTLTSWKNQPWTSVKGKKLHCLLFVYRRSVSEYMNIWKCEKWNLCLLFLCFKENLALIPTLVSARRPVSVPSSTHGGNPQRESPLRPSFLEAAGQKVRITGILTALYKNRHWVGVLHKFFCLGFLELNSELPSPLSPFEGFKQIKFTTCWCLKLVASVLDFHDPFSQRQNTTWRNGPNNNEVFNLFSLQASLWCTKPSTGSTVCLLERPWGQRRRQRLNTKVRDRAHTPTCVF